MTEIFCDPLAPIALVLLKLLFNPLAELKPESKFATSHNQNSFKRFLFSRIYFKSIRLSSDQMLMKITGGLKKTHKRH